NTGQYYANYHIDGCGWGGKVNSDGNDTQCPINGNCRNTPVEVFETRYPWLTKTYRVEAHSGGHGRHRGGAGSLRIIQALAPEITVSSFMDRHETRAWGLFGGEEGASGMIRIRKKGDDQWRTFSEVYGTPSPNKFADIQIQEGDEILIASPGGGGYGPPEEREPAQVLEDVREGFVSPEEARDVYAVCLVETATGDWRIDETTTAQLRRNKEVT
ncbi:MAG: hydantoinase B/oxoprolinase family protein, partial [Candidatus Poribacteria bacterium]|nr:hydantoinase B/oxoprolinase family protein [Candidatus Poribacteria bacterium]